MQLTHYGRDLGGQIACVHLGVWYVRGPSQGQDKRSGGRCSTSICTRYGSQCACEEMFGVWQVQMRSTATQTHRHLDFCQKKSRVDRWRDGDSIVISSDCLRNCVDTATGKKRDPGGNPGKSRPHTTTPSSVRVGAFFEPQHPTPLAPLLGARDSLLCPAHLITSFPPSCHGSLGSKLPIRLSDFLPPSSPLAKSHNEFRRSPSLGG